MKLKAVYKTQEDIPEGYADLYTEKNGQWELTGIQGIKTEADIERMRVGLEKEREAHKKTKERYSFIEDADDAKAKLEKYEELEARADGKIDEEKIEKIVESRVRARVAPIEQKFKTEKQRAEELEKENASLKGSERKRTIHESIRKAAQKHKLRESAIEDAIIFGERVLDLDDDGNIVTKENSGVAPGLDPEGLLMEMQDKRPHWWPESIGAGTRGTGNGAGGIANPFSADHWNMTEQSKVIRDNPTRADQLAKAAGTTVGGSRPEKK